MEDLEEDVKFIVDETLDFGGLSPSDSREEEDIAVSVTPEKPLRRGLSHRSDPNAVAPAPQGMRLSLGPLSPEKLEEILDEANRLAAQLEQCALQERESAGEDPAPRRQVKPSPRRETFVLKDSPVRDLLPTVNSLAWSNPSPSSLTPRLRSSDRKGSVRALRTTPGKRPSSMKRESPTCNLFPASKSPASSPLARSTPPIWKKAGPSGRAAASPPTPVRPVLAPQPSTSSSQRLPRPKGATAKSSSQLPPSAIPRPAGRMPLTSRSVPPSKGALPPDSLSTRKGLPRPSAAGQRVRKSGHKVPVSQRLNLPVMGATRGSLQPPRKVAVPGPTR
ncbi:PREDICTED: LOW QUALITY PROTEIN: proline/serine-rich coiled-coil protein 1 [Propithecus coquereli]|uniref:LOW QUALITY PROTEIN: proline/serine-rich coiled-coil protein 1 n=1 Tax=Propithecus coquereli TaxID=379532 RepID=UPI00063FBE06|nr:PREDICTED: LOW QUALITY PROTEIN: proline/serine-rich coiled-coil protein 1 [Propithecus coquereli]